MDRLQTFETTRTNDVRLPMDFGTSFQFSIVRTGQETNIFEIQISTTKLVYLLCVTPQRRVHLSSSEASVKQNLNVVYANRHQVTPPVIMSKYFMV